MDLGFVRVGVVFRCCIGLFRVSLGWGYWGVLMSWFKVYGGGVFGVGGSSLFLVFIASTATSTVPGISVAGSTPEFTLYTPALDVEYLLVGRPLSSNRIPVTPSKVPTPALLSRVALNLLGLPALIVDAGSYVKPMVPYVSLPSATTGGVISGSRALPEGRSRRLFEESRLLGLTLSRGLNTVIIGESMPGGTTTAMALMEALGYNARGRVSSANPVNPRELKVRVVEEGFRRAGLKPPVDDVFKANDAVGDPLHISIAGFTAGALEAGSKVILAGGTQMCSVLAVLKKLNVDVGGRVMVATTRWIAEDNQSDIMGLLGDIAPEVGLVAAMLSLRGSRYGGLRAYEEGYVKEGVGAGGLLTLLALRGYPEGLVLESIEAEYARLLSLELS